MATLSSLVFSSRFGMLLEKRLSSVAGLEYTMVYGKSQLIEQMMMSGISGRIKFERQKMTMNTKITLLIACISLTLLTGSALQADTIEVVSPSIALPSVVTTENKADMDAAKDFCDYFSRVSDRKITVSSKPEPQGVVIHVGRDEFVKKHAPEIEKLFADGYIVKAVKADDRYHIILAGKIYPSAQWAIEQFLKDYCGVRWLFPDPVYGEIVPSKPTITVDQNLSEKYEPDYLSRGKSFSLPWPPDLPNTTTVRKQNTADRRT